jgi:Fibronectin type III domain
MTNSTKTQLYPVTRTAWISRRLTTVITGLLLAVMPLLTGCGSGGEDPFVSVAPGSTGATATLQWNPVQDSSVSSYFVHYGRQSPNRSGSCAYENSKSVDSSSATITNLDPDATYYFAVSAYNGLESPCSNEVSAQT